MPGSLTKITSEEFEQLLLLFYVSGYYEGRERDHTEISLRAAFDEKLYELKIKTKIK
jgi:hypothetical protein